jgi:hypothetical protein
MKSTLAAIVGITNVQQSILGACCEGCNVNIYASYDVVGGGFNYIHCDLVDLFKYLTTMLTIGFAFVITFSPWLNVCPFIRIYNSRMICKNKFERGD